MILKAFIENYDIIVCFTNGESGEFEVYSDGVRLPVSGVTCSPYDGQEVRITLGARLNPETPCFISHNGERIPAEPLGIYDKPEFNEKYYYDGPLGAEVKGEKTTFRLWAPFALDVRLNLFSSGDSSPSQLTKSMTRAGRGVWTAEINDDLEGTYYTYTVSYNGRTDAELCDPYAVATGLNGHRGMVTSLASPSAAPKGWENEHTKYKKSYALKSYTDAIIWEVHVRDFSGKTKAASKNRFGAFTEKLTNSHGVTIGTDYIADLGVTHVHLLPCAEYATVDQSMLSNKDYNAFNWGYDPMNYNSPMGAYCSDPRDGYARVFELRCAVAALHKAGLGVVFDVAYNHTYNFDAPIACAVPYYYYRFDHRGNPTNGSGCGNETASERPMCRRFIIDSLLYWMKTYHADGFRFDLMALHDTYTMQKVEKALHAVDPSMILYGEGWVGGVTSLDVTRQCHKWNAVRIQPSNGAAGSIAVFSDIMRDSVKGAVFNPGEGGYVNGRSYENVNPVKFSSMGSTSPNFDTNWVSPSADRVINYVSVHDNFTLWDKLFLTMGSNTLADRLRANRMCAAIIFTSRGVPFFQAGEEMLRSKPKDGGGYDENSYNSPDLLNNIDWDALAPDSVQASMRDYYRGLIIFRKAHPALRITGRDEIEDATNFIDVRCDVIVYTLSACGETLLMIYNPLDAVNVPLPEGLWSLRVTGEVAGDIELGEFYGTVSVSGKSVWCLVKK